MIKNNQIKKENLSKLLESNIYNSLSDKKYTIYKIKSKDLLVAERFSVAIKILFLKLKDKDYNFAEIIYKSHLAALTNNEFKEMYHSTKKSFDTYLNEFIEIENDIKNNGFDINKSILPLSENQVIRNGSHRLAAAIKNEKEVSYIQTESKDLKFNYLYFYKKAVPIAYLDLAAIEFFKIKNKSNVVFSSSYDKRLAENSFYIKKIKFIKNGLNNLYKLIQFLGIETENNLSASGINYLYLIDESKEEELVLPKDCLIILDNNPIEIIGVCLNGNSLNLIDSFSDEDFSQLLAHLKSFDTNERNFKYSMIKDMSENINFQMYQIEKNENPQYYIYLLEYYFIINPSEKFEFSVNKHTRNYFKSSLKQKINFYFIRKVYKFKKAVGFILKKLGLYQILNKKMNFS